MTILKRFREEVEPYLDGNNYCLFNILYLFFLNCAFQLNMLYRISSKLTKKLGHLRILWLIPEILLYFEKTLIGSFIDPRAKIGKKLRIIYGSGIIIGAGVEIGDNVTIFNGVTLGSKFPGLPDIRQPKIGNSVFIGTGAKLLGDIVIGDNVKIGANSVVIKSFGPNVIIAGVPAKVVRENQ